MTDVHRLTTDEFLLQLDTADDWMLWMNPQIEEIELIVKDLDGRLSAFHGPHPFMMSEQEYKEFADEVEKIAEGK